MVVTILNHCSKLGLTVVGFKKSNNGKVEFRESPEAPASRVVCITEEKKIGQSPQDGGKIC